MEVRRNEEKADYKDEVRQDSPAEIADGILEVLSDGYGFIRCEIYNASHGTERKWVLEKGNVWTRPTMSMELKSQYHRERSKKEFRKRLEEYKN